MSDSQQFRIAQTEVDGAGHLVSAVLVGRGGVRYTMNCIGMTFPTTGWFDKDARSFYDKKPKPYKPKVKTILATGVFAKKKKKK